MLRWVADENFNNDIIRALLRRKPDIDIVRIQDVGLSGADDPTLLEWAAREGRVLLTHDTATVPKYAYERASLWQRMPGVFIVPHDARIHQVIEDIILLTECSTEDEWEGQVYYLPLR